MSESGGAWTEGEVARVAGELGRKCGDCSLCCLLLDVPEADKPKHGWCRHCRPGKGGCSIYATRPNICRRYACMWLISAKLSDAWMPLRSKLVLDMHGPDQELTHPILRVHVHPQFPNRWREPPYHDGIRALAAAGLDSVPIFYQTIIIVAHKRTHIVLANEDVPYTPGITLRCPWLGKNTWKHVATKSHTDAKTLYGKLNEMVEIGRIVHAENPQRSMAERMVRAMEILQQRHPELGRRSGR